MENLLVTVTVITALMIITIAVKAIAKPSCLKTNEEMLPLAVLWIGNTSELIECSVRNNVKKLDGNVKELLLVVDDCGEEAESICNLLEKDFECVTTLKLCELTAYVKAKYNKI